MFIKENLVYFVIYYIMYIDIYCENNVGFYWVYIMYIIFMNEF